MRIRTRALDLAVALAAVLPSVGGAPAHGHSFGAPGPGQAPGPPVHGSVQGGGTNQPSAAIEGVERVHVVIMTHLDVGFTDFAVSVINTYFHQYFPAAIHYAGRIAGSKDPVLQGFGYVFTSHPWLLSLYLDCPAGIVPGLDCPPETDREAVVRAIEGGVITWQGNAFNVQAALMDPSLYRFNLEMAHELDRRFGKAPKRTVSLRDVPGSSRAVLPFLREEGYRALSVGVNSQVVSAAVSNAFLWLDGEGADPADGVLTLIHPGGYGGVKLQDCVQVPGLPDALCVWVTGDNAGPPSPNAVAQVRRIISQQYPRAEVFASTFDAFVERLEAVRDRLPVVTQEIGDTWLSGPPADPWKIAAFRLMSRARRECLEEGPCRADDPAVRGFSRLLLKAPEHTAGISSTPYLQAYSKDWSNARFEATRNSPDFRTVEASWTEQRGFLEWALATLEETGASGAAKGLAAEIRAELRALRPEGPETPEEPPAGYEPVEPEGPFSCGDLEIGFDPEEGAIAHLVDLRNGREWASAASGLEDDEEDAFETFRRRKLEEAVREADRDLALPEAGGLAGLEAAGRDASGNPLALFLYRTYDGLDFFHYVRQYGYVWPPVIDALSLAAFEKPGVSSALPRSRWWLPQLRGVWRRPEAPGCDFLLELAPPAHAHERYGAPGSLRVGVRVPEGEAAVEVDLRWYDKTTTRLPESLWMLFRPVAPDPDGWRLQVLDRELPPRETVVNGSRHLAAVWEGVAYRDAGGSLEVETTDAGVVSPGTPSLVDYNNRPVRPEEGMYFNLANNVWNTNWPLWYPWLDEDRNARFRFRIVVGAGGGS